MRLPAFDYHSPASLGEAFQLMAKHGDRARLMAGGTDLLPAMKLGRLSCDHLIALKGIAGLDALDFDPTTGLRIGATTVLDDVAKFAATTTHYPALAQAIHDLATEQTRHKPTAPPTTRNAPPAANQRSTFRKFSHRSKVDIATVNLAVRLELDAGKVSAADIFLGTVAPVPMRAAPAEAVLNGSTLDASIIEATAKAASACCQPISDFRASADYKKRLVGVLVRRALTALGESA